ncbi:MAG: hypothetical protein LUH22_18090 [Bacteroides sp.]|nr:hypothetical protein [Bacteroides sp.]
MKSVENKKQENVNVNEVINLSNNSKMEETIFKLNIDFNGVMEPEVRNNQPALELFSNLSTKGYYFMMQPKNNRKGEAYLWITATKQGEDREEFALYVNDEILNVVVDILKGKVADISRINANNLADFNNRITNIEYVLFVNEKSQGRTMKKTYTTNGQTFSSYYKRGLIMYRPYLNRELKAYIND